MTEKVFLPLSNLQGKEQGVERIFSVCTFTEAMNKAALQHQQCAWAAAAWVL